MTDAAALRVPAARFIRGGALILLLGAAAACQSAPTVHSGFLTSYAGLGSGGDDKPGPDRVRDDAASDAISEVFIQPAVLALVNPGALSADDLSMVRNEVDRQICFEVSERFVVLPQASPRAGTIRSAVVGVQPTGRAGSAVAAAAGFFIPVPVVTFRVPMTTGGLAVESELLAPDGSQVAALTWSRRAEIVGRTDPSLSPVGDALQLAEPFGDAVGDAFSSPDREVRKIPDPDPCARYGSRRDIGRMVGEGLVGSVTGLYVPRVAGTGVPATTPEPSDEH